MLYKGKDKELMKILIDADSVPTQIRTIILRAVIKRSLSIIFVADRFLKDVGKAYETDTAHLRKIAKKNGVTDPEEIRSIKSKIQWEIVATGADSADNRLVEIAEEGDLAITHDVPLSARLIEKNVIVLDDRGGTYDKNNIAVKLSNRNLMTELRSYGVQLEKTRGMGEKQVRLFSQAFVTQLDKLSSQA